ncbi:MAG: DUF29 domain-containing protein [Microcystaceae cyanobacterium]
MINLLHDQDFLQWTEEQSKHLENRNLELIDWQNIQEEIESMGRSEKQELANRLEILLEHLLKRCYMNSTYDNRGWELTIKEQRKQIRRLLKASPSLKSYGDSILNEIWLDALSDVQDLYPQANFPPQNPFSDTLDTLLIEMFWLS